MSAAEKQAWDAYAERLAPMAFLRPVDGFALKRLCEDVAELESLKRGKKRLEGQIKREAKQAGEALRGTAKTALDGTSEGRRLQATISAISSRIARAELQFGLTPVSSQRLEGIMLPGAGPVPVDNLEAKLCG